MLCYDSDLQVDLGRTVVSSHFIPLAFSKKPVTVGDRVELLLAAHFHTAHDAKRVARHGGVLRHAWHHAVAVLVLLARPVMVRHRQCTVRLGRMSHIFCMNVDLEHCRSSSCFPDPCFYCIRGTFDE